MNLPTPYDTLANCVWFPRILAKARLLKSGHLPPDYVARFCIPTGVDGQFLLHFNLNRDDILSAAELSDEQVPAWLLARTNPDRIEQWNNIASNLGRPGYPLAERLPIGLATTYKHLADRGFTTIFELIEADEKPPEI